MDITLTNITDYCNSKDDANSYTLNSCVIGNSADLTWGAPICTYSLQEESRDKREIHAEAMNKPLQSRYIIDKIAILQPGKTMRVKIRDPYTFNGEVKDIICVVSEPDVFDMYWGCFIALSKYIHGSDITAEGIEYYAKELSFDKSLIKEVNRAIKQYSKEIEAEKKAEKEAQEKKRQLAAKRAKRAVKKAAKAERERQQRVAEFAEGILLAEQMLAPVKQGH